MSTGITIAVSVHSTATNEDTWEVLSRLFPVQTGGQSQWVTLQTEDVLITFFGPILEPAS